MKSAGVQLIPLRKAPSRCAASLATALAFAALAPPAMAGEGLQIDFGVTYGVPAWNFPAPSGQIGDWNMAGLGTTPLVDLSGSVSGASVSVSAYLDSGNYGGSPTNGEQLLLNDNFYSASGGSWSVYLWGLTPGSYRVFLYAPSHPAIPTGDMTVGSLPVGSLPGDTGSTLIEGTSWVSVELAVTDGSLLVVGSGSGYTGLAGLQLVPLAPRGVNADFGLYYAHLGPPAQSYGAASSQAGFWNYGGGQGFFALNDVSGQPLGYVNITSDSAHGSSYSTPGNDDELLLNDSFWDNGSWRLDFDYQPLGYYHLYFYAPSADTIASGDMNVEGVPVASIPGHVSSVLIEGVSWVKVPVAFTDIRFRIDGSGPGRSGLAGVQLVPIVPGGVNVDFGTVKGVPAPSYGAASGQAGPWNEAGLGFTGALDVTGVQAGTSVTVVAGTDTGSGGTPTNDDELLLFDNFYSSNGDSWSAALAGLVAGEHLVYLYAPSNGVVPTGDMTVGGVPVASLPGDTGGSLIQGTSWTVVAATAPEGVLVITGSGPGYSGLAGLQAVSVPELASYCTAGVSASGCAATLAATGIPSATATSGFVVSATNVEGAKTGMFFFGTSGRQANPWGSGGSFQCVVPPVTRAGLLTGTGTIGSCDGTFSQDLNAHWTAKPAHDPGPGALVQAQLWYRDPLNTSNQTTSLSDALEFMVRP